MTTVTSPALKEKYRLARLARAHAKAIAEGRIPGWPGRVKSTHPKAAYWREKARRRYEARKAAGIPRRRNRRLTEAQ